MRNGQFLLMEVAVLAIVASLVIFAGLCPRQLRLRKGLPDNIRL
jgi:hypothetical protein